MRTVEDPRRDIASQPGPSCMIRIHLGVVLERIIFVGPRRQLPDGQKAAPRLGSSAYFRTG